MSIFSLKFFGFVQLFLCVMSLIGCRCWAHSLILFLYFSQTMQKGWITLLATSSSIGVILALGILGLRPSWFWGMTSLACSVVDTLGTSAYLGITVDFTAPCLWTLALALGLIPTMFVAQVLTATMTQRKGIDNTTLFFLFNLMFT
jgi:hypothetical protein